MESLHHDLLLQIAEKLTRNEELASFRLASKSLHAAAGDLPIVLSPKKGINDRQLVKLVNAFRKATYLRGSAISPSTAHRCFHNVFQSLTHLKIINLAGAWSDTIRCLPESVNSLVSLESLVLTDCRRLKVRPYQTCCETVLCTLYLL